MTFRDALLSLLALYVAFDIGRRYREWRDERAAQFRRNEQASRITVN